MSKGPYRKSHVYGRAWVGTARQLAADMCAFFNWKKQSLVFQLGWVFFNLETGEDRAMRSRMDFSHRRGVVLVSIYICI